MKPERIAHHCESPVCSHRRQSWRPWSGSPSGYSFEGHWYCSMECLAHALVAAIAEVLPKKASSPAKPHRVPLGLLLLSRGLVDNEQLKQALKAQKDSGTGRVGEWLRHLGAVTEEQITLALGLQWSIPVFPLGQSRRFLDCAGLVPLPLLETAEMIPVHLIPTSQTLYVAFVDRINYSALCALEKMLACRTEPCLAAQSHIRNALGEIRNRPPRFETFVDNVSDPANITNAVLTQVERLNATGLKVTGFADFIWARIFSEFEYTDVLFQGAQMGSEVLIASD